MRWKHCVAKADKVNRFRNLELKNGTAKSKTVLFWTRNSHFWSGIFFVAQTHVGMDYAPLKKPSQPAGLFSYRSVIPPFPHKTLLRKLSREPRPTGRGEKRVSILSRQLSLWNRLGKPFPGGFVFAITHFCPDAGQGWMIGTQGSTQVPS